jgi:hypothetical protein
MANHKLNDLTMVYMDDEGNHHPINVQEATANISLHHNPSEFEHNPFEDVDKSITIGEFELELESHKVPVWLARSQRYFKRVWMDYSIALAVERANEKLEKVGVRFA